MTIEENEIKINQAIIAPRNRNVLRVPVHAWKLGEKSGETAKLRHKFLGLAAGPPWFKTRSSSMAVVISHGWL